MPPKNKKLFSKNKMYECILLKVFADLEKNSSSNLHNKILYYPIDNIIGFDLDDVIFDL